MNFDKINKYFDYTLFAFLPNICNSSCDFCYVNPLVGKSAKLNQKIITNFGILVKQMKEVGFKSIRITGGEPLIFRNFDELVGVVKKYDLDYTILTNGQELKSQLKCLINFPPKKISISLHSFKNYEKIFNNKINFKLFYRAVSDLKRIGTKISITIVYQNKNQDEILEMINIFEKKKYQELKIIYPNIKNDKILEKKFKSSKFKSSKITIRFTDFNQKSCLLKNRGFFSIVIANLQSYNCCTTIGEYKNLTKSNNEFQLREVLKLQYLENKKIFKFPCKSFIDCCPIALK